MKTSYNEQGSTDRTRTEKIEKSRTSSDRDQNLSEILDRLGPTKFGKSWTKSDRSVLGPGGPWIPDNEKK